MKHNLWHLKRVTKEVLQCGTFNSNVIILIAYLYNQGHVYCALIETDTVPVKTPSLACLFNSVFCSYGEQLYTSLLNLEYTHSSDYVLHYILESFQQLCTWSHFILLMWNDCSNHTVDTDHLPHFSREAQMEWSLCSYTHTVYVQLELCYYPPDTAYSHI